MVLIFLLLWPLSSVVCSRALPQCPFPLPTPTPLSLPRGRIPHCGHMDDFQNHHLCKHGCMPFRQRIRCILFNKCPVTGPSGCFQLLPLQIKANEHFCAQRSSRVLKIDFLLIGSQTARCIYETEQDHVFAKPSVNLYVHLDVRESEWGCASWDLADLGEQGIVAEDSVSGLLELSLCSQVVMFLLSPRLW